MDAMGKTRVMCGTRLQSNEVGRGKDEAVVWVYVAMVTTMKEMVQVI